jgi:pimeloyl-ACP methyl ester carboxylesterase
MTIERATGVGPSRIDVAYERFGDPSAPALLLIMGAGTQMNGWPDDFCTQLAARGLHVVRFDNRDVGESTHFHDAPEPDLAAVIAGDASSASYRLSDMAADTVGLLDALGVRAAHLVGASLGGIAAQTVAIEHPGASCRSLRREWRPRDRRSDSWRAPSRDRRHVPRPAPPGLAPHPRGHRHAHAAAPEARVQGTLPVRLDLRRTPP